MMHNIVIVGLGHIGRLQHLPCILENSAFALVGVTGGAGPSDAVRVYPDIQTAFDDPHVDAVSLCTPPSVRFDLARAALTAGKHVMLEKPPAVTCAELDLLRDIAASRNLTLFAAWHSQYNLSIAHARAIIAGAGLTSVSAVWHEDVERYHAGQDWIWRAGGFGVLDTGVNAISMLTELLPGRMVIRAAELLYSPGADAPIMATAEGEVGSAGATFTLSFDWRVKTDVRELSFVLGDGRAMTMPASGRHVAIDGKLQFMEEKQEYRRMYEPSIASSDLVLTLSMRNPCASLRT